MLRHVMVDAESILEIEDSFLQNYSPFCFYNYNKAELNHHYQLLLQQIILKCIHSKKSYTLNY